METRLCSLSYKQGTFYGKAEKHKKKTRENAEARGVPRSHGAAIRTGDLGTSTRSSHVGGHSLHPPQPVIRDQAESTKMRIVCDCSAKSDSQVPSLNDCLKVGPPLQPMIFDILMRNRLNFLCITGDIQKAFLQIKVDPKDRDALRLLWYENLDSRTVLQYRFTRVIFGSGPSPYILGATLQKHVSQ